MSSPTSRPTDVVVVVLPPGPRPGADDVDLVRARLADLRPGAPGGLELVEPAPTAAFSGRDRLRPGFRAAQAAAAAHGFAPVIRPVGGSLAVYGDGDLVLHHWAAHEQPRAHVRQRFALVGEAIAACLRGFGLDARVGPVPGEYCDGEFSVNDSGRAKVAGTAQRLVRGGFLVSAVVMVQAPDRARAALGAAYRALDLPFDPATVGCVADAAPGITTAEVRDELVRSLRAVLPLTAGAPAPGSPR